MSDRFAARFLIPGGLWLLLFFAVPLGIVVVLSFGTPGELGGAVYDFNPDNYSRAFDPLFVPVLLRSVGFALATVALCLLLGYPVAYYIARFGGAYKHVLIALVVLPFFVNYLVRTYAWVAILSDEGVLNGLLGDLGLEPVRFVNTPWAVIGGLVYGYLAFMILPVYAALDRMDPSLIEAGKDLYGSGWQTFWNVTWPTTFQGVLAGTVLVFLPAVGRLRERAAARRAGDLHDRQPDPAAVLRRRGLAVRRGADHGDDAVPARVDGLLPALGGAGDEGGGGVNGYDKPRFLRIYVAVFFLVLFLPILLVVVFSFNNRRSLQRFGGFSTEWYTQFFQNESLTGSLVASLEIAFVTMIVGTFLGTVLAFGLVRARTRWSGHAPTC